MLCIVEGPDGAGKTTLIEAIRQRVKRYFWILRSSHPPTHLRQIWTFLRTFEGRPDHAMGLLFDRHPLVSEPIYGPILRGLDLLEMTGKPERLVSEFNAHCRRVDHSPFIIYCRPPIERIAANVARNASEQLEGVVERIRPITDAYDQLMPLIADQIPMIHFDYTVMPIDELMTRLETYLPREFGV